MREGNKELGGQGVGRREKEGWVPSRHSREKEVAGRDRGRGPNSRSEVCGLGTIPVRAKGSN